MTLSHVAGVFVDVLLIVFVLWLFGRRPSK